MKKALVEGGPLSVSFEVYDDFMLYKSGVYHHTGLIKHAAFEPFEVDQVISSIANNYKSCSDNKPCCAASGIRP